MVDCELRIAIPVVPSPYLPIIPSPYPPVILSEAKDLL
jgi:hypothetical protein